MRIFLVKERFTFNEIRTKTIYFNKSHAFYRPERKVFVQMLTTNQKQSDKFNRKKTYTTIFLIVDFGFKYYLNHYTGVGDKQKV